MITQDKELAIQALKKGEIVGLPTETVYGLAANALDARAVAKIYELKKRPVDHPLIVHVSDFKQAFDLASEFPEIAQGLAEKFWPGPLTLVLPKSEVVPDLTTGGLPSVAIRFPAHPIAREVIRGAGFPLAAPSANPFGSISPTTAEHVESSFGKEAPLILDGGACQVGVESTIVGFLEGKPILLRLGGISREELEEVIGPLGVASSTAKAVAPGMLEKHYSPRTRLFWERPEETLPPSPGGRGALCFRGTEPSLAFTDIEVLSKDGDLREAAANLYSALRRLDALSLDYIVAYAFPSQGLGLAINDRLKRASSQK